MKKLFLRDGKLWVGEFPEPPAVSASIYADMGAMNRYERALESAKESAVEVVNRLDFEFALGNIPQEGQLYDLPSGWTVRYDEQRRFRDAYQMEGPGNDWSNWYNTEPSWADANIHETQTRKIARLVPVPLEAAGIVATGIPEAEQPEALAFAVTSTDIEESMEQSRDVRIRADSPRTYETGYLDGYVDGVMVTQDLEPVSPPPRAEECDRLSNAWQRCANKLTAAQDENKRLREALKAICDLIGKQSMITWVAKEYEAARKLLNL